MTDLLVLDHLDVGYGDFQALFSIDLHVEEAETVSIIGANGAGKSTLLKAIVGLVHPMHGDIRYDGLSIASTPAHKRVAQGIALVPEGRRIFPSLSVEENIVIGGDVGRPGPWTKQRVLEAFPLLTRLLHRSWRGAVGWRASDVGHRSSVDGQPPVCCCSTRCRWAWHRSSCVRCTRRCR